MVSLQRFFLIAISLVTLFLVYYNVYVAHDRSKNIKTFKYLNTTVGPTEGENEYVIKHSSKRLLTIFTTFRDRPTKFFIHRNVIMNWANLSPLVQPVLFANFPNDSKTVLLASKHGWLIHKLPQTNSSRPPFFKDMYRFAVPLVDSIFYGYCNSDILFTKGLVNTLTSIAAHENAFNSTLVIGRRTNVNVNESSQVPLYASDQIQDKGKEGKLFMTVAEDFFFIKQPQHFPWHTLKNIVIGRPAYDNYVVAQAIRGNVSVIDATNTVLALHQSGQDGNLAGAKNTDARYNKNIIGSFNYGLGSTQHAQFVSTTDFTGKIFIQRRIFHSRPKPAVKKPSTKKSVPQVGKKAL